MTYETAPTISDRDEEVAERLNEMLYNEFGIPLDDFLIRADGGGELHIDIEDGIGSMED